MAAQSSMLAANIDNDPDWRWAAASEISGPFMQAKKALDDVARTNAFARQALMTTDLGDFKGSREAAELVAEFRRFNTVLDPLVKGLSSQARKLLAQQQARQSA